eukprot:scaffold5898_cov133-Skeletonema_dohrnii-CCMP3373.AAC.3
MNVLRFTQPLPPSHAYGVTAASQLYSDSPEGPTVMEVDNDLELRARRNGLDGGRTLADTVSIVAARSQKLMICRSSTYGGVNLVLQAEKGVESGMEVKLNFQRAALLASAVSFLTHDSQMNVFDLNK